MFEFILYYGGFMKSVEVKKIDIFQFANFIGIFVSVFLTLLVIAYYGVMVAINRSVSVFGQWYYLILLFLIDIVVYYVIGFLAGSLTGCVYNLISKYKLFRVKYHV